MLSLGSYIQRVMPTALRCTELRVIALKALLDPSSSKTLTLGRHLTLDPHPDPGPTRNHQPAPIPILSLRPSASTLVCSALLPGKHSGQVRV